MQTIHGFNPGGWFAKDFSKVIQNRIFVKFYSPKA
jgi:hypothetical protein